MNTEYKHECLACFHLIVSYICYTENIAAAYGKVKLL